jgi:hypothetical protein
MHVHIGAMAAMAAWFLRFALEGERERERRKCRRMWRRGALEALPDLIGGDATGVRMPWHAHAATLACGRSATESGCSAFKARWCRLKPNF